jgi:hypothetical protein
MVAYLPIPGGHIKLAERFVSIMVAHIHVLIHVLIVGGSCILVYYGMELLVQLDRGFARRAVRCSCVD